MRISHGVESLYRHDLPILRLRVINEQSRQPPHKTKIQLQSQTEIRLFWLPKRQHLQPQLHRLPGWIGRRRRPGRSTRQTSPQYSQRLVTQKIHLPGGHPRTASAGQCSGTPAHAESQRSLCVPAKSGADAAERQTQQDSNVETRQSLHRLSVSRAPELRWKWRRRWRSGAAAVVAGLWGDEANVSVVAGFGRLRRKHSTVHWKCLVLFGQRPAVVCVQCVAHGRGMAVKLTMSEDLRRQEVIMGSLRKFFVHTLVSLRYYYNFPSLFRLFYAV